MISYKLRCRAGHAFEGWFRSSADFESQSSRSLLSCPVCADSHIEKAIMAPAVVTRRAKAPSPEKAKGTSETKAPAGTPNGAGESHQEVLPAVSAQEARTAKMLSMMRQLQTYVERNFEDVGRRFPEEARKIHNGETEHRDVFGKASLEEAKELLEEGVPVLPLPKLPKLDG